MERSAQVGSSDLSRSAGSVPPFRESSRPALALPFDHLARVSWRCDCLARLQPVNCGLLMPGGVHRSAKGVELPPDGPNAAPTAKQVVLEGHDTPVKAIPLRFDEAMFWG